MHIINLKIPKKAQIAIVYCMLLAMFPLFQSQWIPNDLTEVTPTSELLEQPYTSAPTTYVWEHNLTADFQQASLNLTFLSEYQTNQSLDFTLDAAINNGFVEFRYLQIYFLDADSMVYASLESFVAGAAVPGSPYHQAIAFNFTQKISHLNDSIIFFKLGLYWNGTEFDQYMGNPGDYTVDLISPYSEGNSDGSGIWILFWEFPKVWMAFVVYGALITLIVGIIISIQKRKKNKSTNIQEETKVKSP